MSDLRRLCRVSLSIKTAYSLISTLPESEFIDSNLPGYKLASKTVNYAGIEQRCLVVQSQERRELDLRELLKGDLLFLKTHYFLEILFSAVR
ncbi:hypothetical protein AAFM79_21585 [Trichormus azollae HNT15244]